MKTNSEKQLGCPQRAGGNSLGLLGSVSTLMNYLGLLGLVKELLSPASGYFLPSLWVRFFSFKIKITPLARH